LTTVWICRDRYYEWDKQAKFVDDGGHSTYPISLNIGTQAWRPENLTSQPTQKVNGYSAWQLPRGSELGKDTNAIISRYGTLLAKSAAEEACESIRYGVSCSNGCKFRANYRLPTLAEWETLFSFADGAYNIGTTFKSSEYWEKRNGSDLFMFSIVPAGAGHQTDRQPYSYTPVGRTAEFWAADGCIVLSYDSNIYSAYTNCGGETVDYKSTRCIADLNIPDAPRNPNKK
jgi:uncharacterized protein (TIGR02145 family)